MLAKAVGALAVHALPCMVGYLAARFAYQTGGGWPVSVVAFLIVAGFTYRLAQFLYLTLTWPPIRFLLTAVYCVPAGFAGYALTLMLTNSFVPSEIWKQVICLFFAAVAGLFAYARLSGWDYSEQHSVAEEDGPFGL